MGPVGGVMVYSPRSRKATRSTSTVAGLAHVIFSVVIEFIFDPPGRQNQKLIFAALALQPLNILLVAVDLGLVAIDLLLLLVVGDLMPLQLIADQSSRT